MQHPSEYVPRSFGGVHVMVVDTGTTIKDERTGREVTVDDHTCCTKGNLIYCTQKIYDKLKEATHEPR